ncbi:ribbon-helix-helix domain-containing protein [Nostoc sp.]|uniref:ribbon-helix-helix domain-containing protein n=1 Tax=Nostoc sp. TaxID=1180 RepID=UPI002FFA6753
MAKLKQTGIRFDLETYKWLEDEAEKTGTPISALVREGVVLLRAEKALMTQMRSQIEAQGVTYPSMKRPKQLVNK